MRRGCRFGGDLFLSLYTVRTVNKRPESSKKKRAAGPETLSLFRQPFLMADSIRRGLFVYNYIHSVKLAVHGCHPLKPDLLKIREVNKRRRVKFR